MKRRFRLTGSTDFKRVRHTGKSYPHPLVVLVVAPSDAAIPRIAVAAGRSVGNAVHRNRAKRVIRGALQPVLEKIHPGWDLIFIARLPITSAASHEIQIAVESLLRRAKLLGSNHVG